MLASGTALAQPVSVQAKRTFKSKAKRPLLPKRKMGDLIAARLPDAEARIAHKAAMDRGADCPSCPLFGLRSGPVMGEIIKHAKLAVVGQEPGGNEVEQKRPFIGESGRILEECMADGGMVRDEASITNAVLCRPPEDFDAFQARLKFEHKARIVEARKTWEAERTAWTERKRQGLVDKSERYPKFTPPDAPPTPQQCCAPRLKRDLDESASSVVMPLGGTALEAVAHYYDVPFGAARKTRPGEARLNSLKKQAGSPATMPNGHIVLASYHPAFGVRKGSRHYMQVIRKHIARGAAIARRGGYDWREPDYLINPRVDTIRDVLMRFREASARVAVDIETDKGSRTDGKFDPFTCRIRCIGLGAVVNGEEVAICVPLRRIDGAEWWSTREEKMAVLEALVAFFADTRIRLMGHNFAFDSSVLLRFKIMRDRHVLYDDSMLMMHDTTACDLPKDLGFTAAFYFEVPAWKGAADDKYYTEVTDYDLHLYNLRDVLTTLRLYDVLIADVYKCGTTDQYDLDRRLAPVARDMGELGLFTDEAKRGELSVTLGAEAWARFVKLRDITQDPAFNPNTPKRIRDFLFGTKGLKPEFNAKGMQLEEGEDPSTNANALLAIQTKQKVDQETNDFINNIFEYRAYTKLLGTYVNNLPVHYPDWAREGHDVGYVDSVMGRVFSKWSKEERVSHYNATGEWKEGEWREDIVIPRRPAIGRLFTTYKIHVIPSGRMSSQPACFDAETEILTRRGWLRFSMLTPDDEVAQYHWEDGTIEFVKPTSHIAYRHEGEMVRINGEHLDVLCTPDHKFWFRTRARRKTVEVEAKDWPSSVDVKVPVAGVLRASGQPSSGLSEAELRFLLAAQADGYVNSGGYWEFSFTKDRKVKALASALAELGYTHTVAPKKNGRYNQTRFVVKDPRAAWVDSYLARDGVEKTFVATKMLSLPVGNLVFITDEVMLWDGCATRKNHYSSSNKANADLIQAIHVLVGRAAKVRRYENERLTKPNWQVDVRAQDEALNYTQQSRVPYNGTVYCVSVPSSMIVVRRNNKPIIAGNCQNWPERGKANMREMITSPPGHVIVGADLDQVELRLYAVISGDRLLLKAFNTAGMDPHAYNAASLFARVWKMNVDDAYQYILSMPSRKRAEAERKLAAQPLAYQVEGYKSADDMLASYEKKGEQEKKKHRNIAKTFVYLELYGGEAEKLFMFMSMARDKATGELMFPDLREEMVHEWHDQWHKHHPETKSWQETCAQVARVEGYTAAPFGSYRKRFFPGGPNKPAAVFNHVIQSSAAEIANRAILEIAQRIPYGSWSPYTGLCLQVHDYIGVYCPEERAQEAAKIIEEALCCKVFGIDITASAKASKTWAKQ